MVLKDFRCDWCGNEVELSVPSSLSETGCTKEGCPGVMHVIFKSPPHLAARAIPTRNKTMQQIASEKVY